MDKEQFGFLTPTKGGDDKNMYHVGWLLIHPNDNSLNRFGNFDPDWGVNVFQDNDILSFYNTLIYCI